MPKYQPQLQDLPAKLAQAQKILVALPSTVTVDELAAGLAIYLSLEQASKQVYVVSEETLRVSHGNLFGVGEVKTQFPEGGGGSFVITLENVVDEEGKVPSEKLDWTTEGRNLNLVFHVPQDKKFEPTNISTRSSGNGFDLIILVGVTGLNELGNMYIQNSQKFSDSTIVNIDNSSNNSRYGQYNILDTQASSASEMIWQLLPDLGLTANQDIASNIVAGIYSATNNLTQNVTPETFMTIGNAMQMGAKMPQPTPVATTTPAMDHSQNQIFNPIALQPIPSAQNYDLGKVFNLPQSPVMQAQEAKQKEKKDDQKPPQMVQSLEEAPRGEYVSTGSPESGEYMSAPNPETQNPTPDWLTPKVYKGGNLG